MFILFKIARRCSLVQRKSGQKGSASVEFMFAFVLLLWMFLGFLEIVFQGYNAVIVNYGSYMGSRGYIVDTPGGYHWKEGAETIALGTMMHRVVVAEKAYSGEGITLAVTSSEMFPVGIIYGDVREGTLAITTDLGEQEDEFSGDND